MLLSSYVFLNAGYFVKDNFTLFKEFTLYTTLFLPLICVKLFGKRAFEALEYSIKLLLAFSIFMAMLSSHGIAKTNYFYMNKSIVAVLIIVLYILSIELIKNKLNLGHKLVGLLLCFCFIVILESRTALFALFYVVLSDLRSRMKLHKVIMIAFLLISFLFLFFIRQDASIGRILIYNVQLTIIQQNPIFGIGGFNFPFSYNSYQAAYLDSFESDIYRKLLADETYYSFNLPLKIAAEFGAAGFLLFTSFGILIYQYLRRNKLKIKSGHLRSLSVLLIASLFSYPLEVSIGKLIFILIIGQIIVVLSKVELTDNKKRTGWLLLFVSQSILLVGVFIFSIIIQSNSFKNYGRVDSDIFGSTFSSFCRKNSNEIEFQYSEFCFYNGDTRKCLDILMKLDNKINSGNYFRLMSASAKELGKFDLSEQNLVTLKNLKPSDLKTLYELMHLYIYFRKNHLAKKAALELLNTPMKFNTPAYQKYRKEAVEILVQNTFFNENEKKDMTSENF